MTIHNWQNDWQAWLLSKAFVPIHRMSDLIGFSWEWELRDKCKFTAGLAVASPNFEFLDYSVDQFLYVQREDKAQVFLIEIQDQKWKPIKGRKTLTVDLGGTGGASYFLSRRVIQDDPATDNLSMSFAGKADDVIKQFIRYACETGYAYNDRNGASRVISGLTVAADKSEYPDDVTERMTGNLWEAVRKLCLDYNIDLTFTPTWNGAGSAVTFTVETHYQGRGTDKTPGNADPVVLSDIYRVLTESAVHNNKFPLKTHAYSTMGTAVVAGNSPSDHIRSEVLVQTSDEAALRRALLDTRDERGHTFGYRETRGIQLGRDFWLGDTVSHYDKELDSEIKDELLSGTKIVIQNDALGSEQIQLVFGDKKPDSAQNRRGSSGGRPIEPLEEPSVTTWLPKADDGNVAVPDTAQHITVAGGTGADTSVSSSTLTVDTVWKRLTTTLAPATNNDSIYAGDTQTTASNRLHIQKSGAVYMRAQATASVLFGADASIGVIDNLSGASISLRHNGVGAESLHANTVGVYVVNSGNLYVQTGAVGSTTKFWVQGSTGNTEWFAAATMTWEGTAYRMPQDAPAVGEALCILATGAPNTTEWAAPAPAAHDILSTAHGDTLAAGVSQGSIIIGNATPKWSELTIGTANKVLQSNGTTASWETLTASDLSDGVPNTRTLTAGAGLTGGGDLSANRTFDVGAGTGITVNANDVAIANTAVTPATYGDATHVGQFTVDQQGRLTAAADVLITGVTPSAHDLLSAQHGDTLAAAVMRGSIIIGNVTPEWKELVIGAANAVLESDGTTASWVLPDIYGTPGTCTVSTNNTGGMGHTHAITSSSVPGAAESLLKTNPSGHLTLVQLTAPTVIFTAGEYIDSSAGVLRLFGDSGVDLDSRWVVNTAGHFNPQGAFNIGYAGGRVAIGYFSALNVNGNITVTGTVDGVNVSSHTHPISGDTANFSPSYNSEVVDSHTFGAGTAKYIRSADDAAGNGAVWRLMYGKSGTHKHGTGTLVTAAP